MEFLILVLMIFTIAMPLSNLFKKKIETVIPIAVIGITAIIYIFGLFDNLNLGVKVVEILSILMAIYNIVFIIKSIKQKTIKQELKRLVTPGLCVYITIIFIFIIINTGRIFEDYDEFNHWALIIKNMFMYNEYGTAKDSIVRFNEYPPFTATFQYILLNLKGLYSEDLVIIAHNILYLSMIIPLCQKADFEKNFKNLIVIIPTILLMPVVFYDYFFVNILVDAFLGILFAIGLFIIYKKDENKLYKKVYLSSIILALALTKTTGVMLALFLVIIEFIKNLKNKKGLKNTLKNILVISTVPVILTLAWYLKINMNQTQREWDFNTLLQSDERNELEIVKLYFGAFFKKLWITERGFTVATVMLLIGAYSLYLYKTRKTQEEKKEYVYIFCSWVASTLTFFIGLLLMYLRLFTEQETLVLSSFIRYTSTMSIACVLLNTFILIDSTKVNKSFIYVFLAILISVIPLETINNKYICYKKYINNSIIERSYYSSIKRFKYLFNKNDKICYLSNTGIDNVYIYKMCRYEMMGVNIGDKVINDVKSIDSFKEELINNDYTYLYIFRADDKFKKESTELFEENECSNDSLYKIQIDKDKQIKLVRIN